MLRQKLKYILIRRCMGRSNASTVKDLAAALGTHSSHDTVPHVRQLIRDLIKQGCPIASCQHGYFWISNRDELEDYREVLQGRIDAMANRLAHVTKAYEQERNARHRRADLPLKDRCRHYVIYLAETMTIPYQAVWSMAYRKFSKTTKIDTVNLPEHYTGSVLNYINNLGRCNDLYGVLKEIEEVLI